MCYDQYQIFALKACFFLQCLQESVKCAKLQGTELSGGHWRALPEKEADAVNVQRKAVMASNSSGHSSAEPRFPA